MKQTLFKCKLLNVIVFHTSAVKLPELLAYVNIEDETLIRLQQKMIDFLKYWILTH